MRSKGNNLDKLGAFDYYFRLFKVISNKKGHTNRSLL
jgi:hypothetical protein